jgi:flagellar FliL protein
VATSKEAPKKEKEKDGGTAEEAPKKSKKLLIIIVAAVVLLGLIGGGAFFMFKKKPAAEGENGAAPTAEETASKDSAEHAWPKFDPSKPPVFVPLEPFTVNLQDENGEQYLQVVASVRVIDDKVGEEVKKFMPQIRHEILTLLAGKKASDIMAPDDREALADEIKDTINEIMGWTAPDTSKKKKTAAGREQVGPVVAVFFTQFIIQ